MKSNFNAGNSTVVGSIIVVAVLLIGAGVWNYSAKSAVATNNASPTVATADSGTTAPLVTDTPATTPADVKGSPVSALLYKDGSYNAVGEYNSPGGAESIEVALVLKGDEVVDATVVSGAKRSQSVRFQTLFIENFKPFVIGKNIDEITLSKVSGSSLTPKGFNDALAKIKAEAKA